ncbi:proteasome subunit alpha, partial [Streptomyces goshikiensis]
MSTPFYVSPQQAMADRAGYAPQGLAPGRAPVVVQFSHGHGLVGGKPPPARPKV